GYWSPLASPLLLCYASPPPPPFLPRRHGVHSLAAAAVQPPGDRVGLTAELPASVQGGHHHLDGRALLHRVVVDRDAAAPVIHPDPAVGEQGDLDPVVEAGQRLVDRVVHHLMDEMVQATFASRAD